MVQPIPGWRCEGSSMLVERLLKHTPLKNEWICLLVGSVATALLISLGMIAVLSLIDFTINPAIPSAFGAIGGALFAARAKQRSDH